MLLAYFLTYGKKQWITLLVGSYIFYAFAGLDCLAFILITTVSSYLVSRLLGRAHAREREYLEQSKELLDKAQRKEYKAKAKKKRFRILLCGLFFNFGILAVLKYSAFAVRNVNSIIGLFGAEGLSVPSLLYVYCKDVDLVKADKVCDIHGYGIVCAEVTAQKCAVEVDFRLNCYALEVEKELFVCVFL